MVIVVIVISMGYFGILGKKKFEHHSLLEELHSIEQIPIEADRQIDSLEIIKVHTDRAGRYDCLHAQTPR